MLAKGDTCVFQRIDDATCEFGVVEYVDNDRNRVLISIPRSKTESCWVRGDHVRKLRNAGGDLLFQCLDSLNESYIKMQLVTAKLLRDKMDDRRPSAGRTYKEDEYLCERMNELGTCDEGQEPIGLSEEEVEPSLHEWGVGDVCVCRWSEDNKWYFAEIIDITEKTGYCDVQFLYYGNEQYFVRLDRIHRVDASSWKWVEDEDNISAAQELLKTKGMRSCRRELQARASVANPAKIATRLRNPNVGDICVCQWGGDAQFYFVKIVAIDITERIYKVRLFRHRNRVGYVPFENIYPYYSSEACTITHGQDLILLQREIIKQISPPTVVPDLSVQSGKPDVNNVKAQDKRGSRQCLTKTGYGPVLSKFWRNLLLETYSNDEKAVRNLLYSWYMCGYQTGYAMAYKIKSGEAT
ncbi:hypothetical protein TcWFU_004548 [Taenia crassiceps]|uniref:Tudor domain-containing protein n=1 Tax=Taenia crassiceps TaxID=6207 RepID=A0ABR4QL19_9CEST